MNNKLLIITPFKNGIGGVEVVTNQLASLLEKSGYLVDYLTLDDVKRLTWFDRLMAKVLGKQFLTRKLYKKINQSDYFAVICNGEYGEGISHINAIGYFHGSYLGLRDLTLNGLNLKNYLVLSFRAYQQKRAGLNKKIVSVSEYLNEILMKQKINVRYTILNPIDTTKFVPVVDQSREGLVYVGRYEYYSKGFDVLHALAKHGHEITCITNTNPGGLLKFKPMIPNQYLPELINNFKILILPSRFESFGMVVVEAMACGLPIIMNCVGIGLEIKKNIPEFILDNIEELAEIESRIKLINENYESFSMKSRDLAVKLFSKTEYLDKWIKVIND